jgi:hypothetical protein
MTSPSVVSSSSLSSDSYVNSSGPTSTDHVQPATHPHQPHVQGLGANNQSLMGGMWANAKWFGGEVLNKYGALTSWAGGQIIGPAYSDEQLSSVQRLAKERELLAQIALLESLNNAQKNQTGNIPVDYQTLNPGDIKITKREDNNTELQERFNVVTGVFTDPVSGIQASILKNSLGEIVVAFADNKEALKNPAGTFVNRALGLLHKQTASEPPAATLSRAKELIEGVLKKYPDHKVVLSGCGSGVDLVLLLELTHSQDRVSKVILNTASGLEAEQANYTAQVNRLIDSRFNQEASVNGLSSKCWKGEGKLPHQVKINSVGDAVVVGTARFGVGLLFGGPLAAAVSGARTAVSYGVQGLPWYTYTLSRQNAIDHKRGQTDSLTEEVLGQSTKLLGSVKHASGLGRPERFSALDLSEIPDGFKTHYNVVNGIFEDKKTGNRISILRSDDGSIVMGFAGTGDSFWHHLAEDLTQEFKGLGSGTNSYLQTAKLFEGMLTLMNKKCGVKSNIVLTGHARWGGVVQSLMAGKRAQEVINNHQLTAYVFNSVGISHATRQQHSEEVWNKVGENIIHVRVDNDWLTRGLQHPVNGPTSSMVVAGTTCAVKAEGRGPFGGHGLTAIERGLEAKKQELDNAL